MKGPARIVQGIRGMLGVFALLLLIPVIFTPLDPADSSLPVLGAVPSTMMAFLMSSAICGLLYYAVRWLLPVDKHEELGEKDAYIAIGVGWLMVSFLGTLPFLLSGFMASFAEAWFESMSGLTATGATVILHTSDAPTSIVVYRALLQYAAGLGIIILGIGLLTRLTHGGAQLVAGDPSQSRIKLRPRMRQTAQVLWRLYAIYTGILVVLYTIAIFASGHGFGDSVLAAVLYACATISTGGFSPDTGNIAVFGSFWVEAVALVGMLAAGTSFALHDRILRGEIKQVLRNSEFRFYLILLAGAALAVTGILWRSGIAITTGLWDAVFTVVSFGTSTGFTITDHGEWPSLAKMALLVLMFTGAMAGSTAGGLKVLRVMILLKVVRRELRKLLHPRAVIPIRHGGNVVKEQTLLTIIAYFFTYITVWMAGAVLLIGTDPDLGLFDGAAAAAAAIGNTGPAMGSVGPFESYGHLQPTSQAILAGLMWIGRIEIFSAMLMLSPSSWRN